MPHADPTTAETATAETATPSVVLVAATMRANMLRPSESLPSTNSQPAAKLNGGRLRAVKVLLLRDVAEQQRAEQGA